MAARRQVLPTDRTLLLWTGEHAQSYVPVSLFCLGFLASGGRERAEGACVKNAPLREHFLDTLFGTLDASWQMTRIVYDKGVY